MTTTVEPLWKHRATFRDNLLEIIDRYCWSGARVLDPFAGLGGIHGLRDAGVVTTGVEIQPRWADCSPFRSTCSTSPAAGTSATRTSRACKT